MSSIKIERKRLESGIFIKDKYVVTIWNNCAPHRLIYSVLLSLLSFYVLVFVFFRCISRVCCTVIPLVDTSARNSLYVCIALIMPYPMRR